MLGLFQGVDDEVGKGGGKDFVADLEGIASGDHVSERPYRNGAGEGEDDDEHGVDGLADDGGADGPGPEFAAVGEELEASHGVGVGELAGRRR